MSTDKHDIEIDVPATDAITSYDKDHMTLYLRILDADAAGSSLDEIAATLLGIDPRNEPEKAARAASSHLRRAQWMTTHGYRLLLT